MNQVQMTNFRLVDVLKGLNDESGKILMNKKLPTKLLYALHRSIPQLQGAYAAYEGTLNGICKANGVTLENMEAEDPERQERLHSAIYELMNQEVTIDIHQIDPDTLNRCGEDGYDPLTYAEMARISWLIAEE